MTKTKTLPLDQAWHPQTVVFIEPLVWYGVNSTVCWPNYKQIFHEMVVAPQQLEHTWL